jgi:hypothetical protein
VLARSLRYIPVTPLEPHIVAITRECNHIADNPFLSFLFFVRSNNPITRKQKKMMKNQKHKPTNPHKPKTNTNARQEIFILFSFCSKRGNGRTRKAGFEKGVKANKGLVSFFLGSEITVSKACLDWKAKWDECHDKWYKEKFLKGFITPECRDQWEDYQECIYVRCTGLSSYSFFPLIHLYRNMSKNGTKLEKQPEPQKPPPSPKFGPLGLGQAAAAAATVALNQTFVIAPCPFLQPVIEQPPLCHVRDRCLARTARGTTSGRCLDFCPHQCIYINTHFVSEKPNQLRRDGSKISHSNKSRGTLMCDKCRELASSC